MNAKEHARKMLVKRNHPDHLNAPVEKQVQKPIKPAVEKTVSEVTPEGAKPKTTKKAVAKKVEVKDDTVN